MVRPISDKRLIQNKTEAHYDDHLNGRKLRGEILDYKFEPFKLILVHNIPKLTNEMSYKPDFLVVFKDRFEIHEVKGFWQEDARLKIKMASELFPWFRFVAVQLKKGLWSFENF